VRSGDSICERIEFNPIPTESGALKAFRLNYFDRNTGDRLGIAEVESPDLLSMNSFQLQYHHDREDALFERAAVICTKDHS
jgi:hypothetical protein